MGTNAGLDSVCHSRPFWLPTKYTSILPYSPWAEEDDSSLLQSTSMQSRAEASSPQGRRSLCAAAVAREPDQLPWTQTQQATAGGDQERPHTPGPPERQRASLDELLSKCSVLQQLILGCPVSCTSVASVSGQFKPSLEVGKNAFSPILQDHTLQSQLLRLPAAGLLG